MTLVTNKHLLPVYDKPMIFYPLETLKSAGIKDIMIITGPESTGDFLKLLGSGKDYGVSLTYRVQDEAGGIAQALGLCERFVGGEKVAVILGDNVLEEDLSHAARKFESLDGAMVFLKEVPDAERFGVAVVQSGKITKIVEKPKEFISSYAVTGIYFYDSDVFSKIRTLKPSARGELEITDVNNSYLRESRLNYGVLKGFWTDAGTIESLQRASELARKKKNGEKEKR
jgi:glucose-1-phosphate thymidylyltransferase